MPGWGFDGRKMTLEYEHGSISYVSVSDSDAKNIGVFVMGFGFFLVFLAIVATSELFDHGTLNGVPFREGTEMIALPLFLMVYLTIWFMPRGAFALIIMAVAFIAAVGYGREALELHSKVYGIYMILTWFLGLLASFAFLWPYPWWQGLVLAYLFGSLSPLMLLVAQLDPGPDTWTVVGSWVIGLLVMFFGITLRGFHSYQQGLEGAHYIRFGD